MTPKDVIRSLRIPARLDGELRKLAAERATSVNAVVEAELEKLVNFERFADELEYAVVRKAWLKRLVEYMSEEEIREFGEWSGMGPGSEAIHFHNRTTSLDSVLRTFEEIGARYSRFFTFRHESQGTAHTIILNHGMGMNWSIFYEVSLKRIFRDILGLEFATELSDNIVIGRFETQSSGPSNDGVALAQMAKTV